MQLQHATLSITSKILEKRVQWIMGGLVCHNLCATIYVRFIFLCNIGMCTVSTMPAHKWKPRDRPPSYQGQPKKPKVKDTPATSAQPARTTRPNLTLSDWLTVFAYVDAHQAEPEVSRAETLRLCQRLEGACLQFRFFRNTDPTLPLELLKQIRLFRAHLRRDELLHGRQTTIDSYFVSPLGIWAESHYYVTICHDMWHMR